jgi:DNA-binding NtrC family response regulator
MLIRKLYTEETELRDATHEVMVVSRDPNVCGILRSWLASQIRCQAAFIDKTEDALHRYQAERPEFVVLDVASGDDLATLEQFRKIDREIPIVAVAVAAPRLAARVVEAMRLGAADVVSAPFVRQDVEAALSGALRQRQIMREMATLRREVRSQSSHTMLFGTGNAMAELRDLIDRVVDTDVPVLIRGETGTGKELVARALAASPLRRGKPFVKINCAALPGELFEAELFGFERGAFTGAIQSKPGKFEMANGGTIFLDEVGEIPPHLQSKLLQVLQDGHFSRLGGHREVHSIVRVIAATNRDLDRAVIDGQFRQDLLFRLNVVPMYVPPLRERRADIPLLADFFLKRWAVFYNRRYVPISAEMMEECLQYGWPGNIRELENLIQRTVILGTEGPARKALSVNVVGAAILVRHAAVDFEPRSLKRISRVAGRQAEAMMIQGMLKQTHGNRKQAAINLGICYKAFLHKARQHRW